MRIENYFLPHPSLSVHPRPLILPSYYYYFLFYYSNIIINYCVQDLYWDQQIKKMKHQIFDNYWKMIYYFIDVIYTIYLMSQRRWAPPPNSIIPWQLNFHLSISIPLIYYVTSTWMRMTGSATLNYVYWVLIAGELS